MQLRVLGPVDARADRRSLALSGAKQRAVLAMLGLEANRTVSADHLIVWANSHRASAAKMLQNYVLRLRGLLGAGAGLEILTRWRDYELRIDPESVDVCRVERLLTAANRAAGGGAPVDAAREALALRRGPACRTWPTSRSRRRRSGGWRNSGWRRQSSDRRRPPPSDRGEINALVADAPLAGAFPRQRMLACIAVAARRRRTRPTAMRGGRW
jgi:hypothetical protein